MKVLLDTNVLTALINTIDERHETAVRAVEEMVDAGETIVLVPQSLFEFWAVATRAKGENGLRLSADRALRYVRGFRERFPLLLDEPDLTDTFFNLMARHKVAGVNSHDGRLVAAMLTHGIPRMATFNAKDFRRYDETRTDRAIG